VLDFFWINFYAKKVYNTTLPNLMVSKLRLFPALLFYIVFCLGFVFLVLKNGNTLNQKLINGAIYGLATYGTFAFTNWAILKDFSLKLVLSDVIWGIFLSIILVLVLGNFF